MPKAWVSSDLILRQIRKIWTNFVLNFQVASLYVRMSIDFYTPSTILMKFGKKFVVKNVTLISTFKEIVSRLFCLLKDASAKQLQASVSRCQRPNKPSYVPIPHGAARYKTEGEVRLTTDGQSVSQSIFL
jgi:hypothetical protein